MAMSKSRQARPPRPPRSKVAIISTLLVLVLVGVISFVLIANRAPDSNGQNQVTGDGETNPLAGRALYVEPNSNAARQANLWRNSRPDDARQMDKLAALPSSRWFGEQANANDIRKYVQGAKQANQMPVLVAYNILNRDCGKYSAGGASDVAVYQNFINMFKDAIADSPATVILEPDALAQMDGKRNDGQPCLSETEKETYFQLFNYSVDTLKSLPNTVVYLDAGNSGWQPDAQAMADKLNRAGIQKADGFSLNISNFRPTDETVAYGTEIAHRVGDKHFVVDTSRNGAGPYTNPHDPAYNWCNPPGRALGHYPTTNTGKELVDAFLYIKNAGESDGADPDVRRCFGGPKAGVWWPEYALGLVQRWPAELQPRQ